VGELCVWHCNEDVYCFFPLIIHLMILF
jgi:hypothetical protein